MYRKGFTLIEIMLVMAITIMLIGVTFPVYDNFFKQGKLDVAKLELEENLKNIQARAMAGVHDLNQGIYFNSNDYIAYQGNSYATRNSVYDQTYGMPDQIVIVNAPAEINFAKKNGAPTMAETITLQNQIDESQVEVGVNGIGVIE